MADMALGEEIGGASGNVRSKSSKCRRDTKNGNLFCDGGKL
jgi:hypothetical protein